MAESTILGKVETVSKYLSQILSLERLELLASRNMFVNMALSEALMHCNYVLLTWDRDVEFGGWLEEWTGQLKSFDNEFDAKLAAIGFCFAHSAGKLDNLLSTAAVRQLLGAMDMAKDIAKAALGASKVAQSVELPNRLAKKGNPGRPPKRWFDKMVKAVEKGDVENPNAVVGDIWYNQLSESKRQEIMGRYE